MLTPLAAGPKVVPDCDPPRDAATLTALDASVTGGVLREQSITVPAGLTLTLDGDLILVAEDDIQVDGKILVMAGARAPVNVTLASLHGSISVSATGEIGKTGTVMADGRADGDTGRWAQARGLPGTNAGFVRLLAPEGTIDVEGAVRTAQGGGGGDATARGNAILGFWGGGAQAAGAQGGAGGDVLLCAVDGINLSGEVVAGDSGAGGSAIAISERAQTAEAMGGPGHEGGTVTFHGLAPDMMVGILGRAVAGRGHDGGRAKALVFPPDSGPGGKASAIGGDGLPGGTVKFISCDVVSHQVVDAGMGGAGGEASGRGGDGGVRRWGGGGQSHPGGSFELQGGHGGLPGDVPLIPHQVGAPSRGTVGASAPGHLPKGGDAAGTAGSGGPPPAGQWWRRGGDSGTGTAVGGAGGVSRRPARPMTAAVVRAAAVPGSPGATGLRVTSPGTP